MNKNSDGANVRFPPPLIYVAGLALGMVARRFLHLPGFGLPPAIRDPLGGAFVIAGFLISFAGVGLFLRRRVAIIPYKPAAELVTSGIYRWTRNPMYLGMALIYAGVALSLNNLAALLLLPAVLAIIQWQVIMREEAYLRRAFGAQYVAYANQVRMWL